MNKVAIKPLNIKKFTLAFIILMACILPVFPEAYYLCNIAIVLLSVLLFFMSGNGKVSVIDVLIFSIALLEIAVSMDVSRIAIFIFYLFLRFSGTHTQSTIKMCTWIMLLFFSIISILYCFGFHAEYDRYSWDAATQLMIEERALGFTNPNGCMLFFFCISCLMLLLSNKIWQYFIILGINYVLFYFTQSRTFFYMIFFAAVVLTVLKVFHLDQKKWKINGVISYVFPIFLILSVGVSKYFAGTRLDDVFRGRLKYCNNFLNRGISLWGILSNNQGSVDNAYIHMLIEKGLVYTVVFALILFFAFRKVKITNKTLIILLTIFSAALMEVIFFECTIMLLISVLIGINKETKDS